MLNRAILNCYGYLPLKIRKLTLNLERKKMEKDMDIKTTAQPNNPMHGVTLEKMLTFIRQHYSWKEMNQIVELNCFYSHPSIKSSLVFLRKHEWARKKVEKMYLDLIESLPITK